mmetsp:Transcript_32098/g.75348  ORF Transcript_32098/g.75348 Transcript_32098/m.75348 type:complete len:480 (-) Transcript_32098:171-1610(-)
MGAATPDATDIVQTPRSSRQWIAMPMEPSFGTSQVRVPRRADSVKAVREDNSIFFDTKVMDHHRHNGLLYRDRSAPVFRPGLSSEKLASLERAGVKPVSRDCSPWSAGDRYGIFEGDFVEGPAGEEQHERHWLAERRHFAKALQTRQSPFGFGGNFAAAVGDSACSRSPSRSASVHDLPVAGYSHEVTPRSFEQHPNPQRRHFGEDRCDVEVDEVRPARRHFPEIMAETLPPTPRGSGRKRFEEIPGAAAKPARTGRRHFSEEVFGVTEEHVQDPATVGRRHFLGKSQTLQSRQDSRWGMLQNGDAATGLAAGIRPGRRRCDDHRAAIPASLREDGNDTGSDRGRRRITTPPMPSTEAIAVGYNKVQLYEQSVQDPSHESAAGTPQWKIGLARGALRNEGILGLGGGKRRIDDFLGGPPGHATDGAVERAPRPLSQSQPHHMQALQARQQAKQQQQRQQQQQPQSQTTPRQGEVRPAWR